MTAFNNLAPRERLLIGLMVILIALFLIWQFFINPVLSNAQTAQRQLDAAKRDHMIVSAGLPKMTPLTGGTQKAAFNRSAVIETARSTNVAISRLQPSDDGGVQLWLEDSPTASVYSFISQLDKRYSVSTSKAQITRRDGGVIAAQFTFTPQ